MENSFWNPFKRIPNNICRDSPLRRRNLILTHSSPPAPELRVDFVTHFQRTGKRENSNSALEKPGKHYLNQTMKGKQHEVWLVYTA